MKTESPSERLATSASGVVRASRIIRSEWRTREMKTFCPFTTYLSPRFTAVVRIFVVSVPAAGSVTAMAWIRSRPSAIAGR
jgi:hypothetical protein